MLLKWWQWYEPYYVFPMQVSRYFSSLACGRILAAVLTLVLHQVKISVKTATVQRNMPTAAAFKEFLKGEESLSSFNISECETYCLANIIGVPIHQVTTCTGADW